MQNEASIRAIQQHGSRGGPSLTTYHTLLFDAASTLKATSVQAAAAVQATARSTLGGMDGKAADGIVWAHHSQRTPRPVVNVFAITIQLVVAAVARELWDPPLRTAIVYNRNSNRTP
jgi:hypothetical protein